MISTLELGPKISISLPSLGFLTVITVNGNFFLTMCFPDNRVIPCLDPLQSQDGIQQAHISGSSLVWQTHEAYMKMHSVKLRLLGVSFYLSIILSQDFAKKIRQAPRNANNMKSTFIIQSSIVAKFCYEYLKSCYLFSEHMISVQSHFLFNCYKNYLAKTN